MEILFSTAGFLDSSGDIDFRIRIAEFGMLEQPSHCYDQWPPVDDRRSATRRVAAWDSTFAGELSQNTLWYLTGFRLS